MSDELDEAEVEDLEEGDQEEDLEEDDLTIGEDDEPEGEPDDDEDDLAAKFTDLEKKHAELTGRYEGLEKHKKDLDKALHQQRQKAKTKPPDGDETLTPEQLRGLMTEHKDDPDTLYNIMQYMVKQGVKGATSDATEAAEIAQTKKDLGARINKDFTDLEDPDSEGSAILAKTKDQYKLNDHPFGDFLGTACAVYNVLPDIIKNAGDEAVKKAMKGKNGLKPAVIPKGKGGKGGKSGALTGDFAKTAKQMGMTASQQKIYATMVSGKGASVSVDD